MKRNFQIRYAQRYQKSTDITGNLPVDSRYPVRYARAKLYRWDDGSYLVNQYYKRFQFYIELFEFKLKNELQGCFTINETCLFLFLMLDGSIHFYTSDGRTTYSAKKGICYATSNDTGDFNFIIPQGTHLFFYLQPKGDYLNGYPDDYPDLAELLKSVKKEQKQYSYMPCCLVEGEILIALLNLSKLIQRNGQDLEIEFYKYCRELLIAYNKVVRLKLEKPVYQIKDFIAANYTDHKATSIKALAMRFDMSVRTLERKYQKEFETSPQQYLNQLRMEKSRELILNNMQIYEVSIAMGYADTSSFSRAFKRYFRYSPKQANVFNENISCE